LILIWSSYFVILLLKNIIKPNEVHTLDHEFCELFQVNLGPYNMS
jgi:hypothetical protein